MLMHRLTSASMGDNASRCQDCTGTTALVRITHLFASCSIFLLGRKRKCTHTHTHTHTRAHTHTRKHTGEGHCALVLCVLMREGAVTEQK